MSSTANCKRENTKKTIFFRNEAVRMFAERYDLFFYAVFTAFPFPSVPLLPQEMPENLKMRNFFGKNEKFHLPFPAL